MDVGNGLGGGRWRLPAQSPVRALAGVVAHEVGELPLEICRGPIGVLRNYWIRDEPTPSRDRRRAVARS
jgi:hypothetical protein